MGFVSLKIGINAIFDSGPIIHLAELGILFLVGIFNTLETTDVVIDETLKYISAEDMNYLMNSAKIHIHEEKNKSEKLRALSKIYSLDFGEITALTVCCMKLEDNELVFFSDDSAARMASEALGITSIGTIGIIIKSASIGKISKGKAIEIIESINSGSTLYVKSSLVQTIVERLRNEWGIPE